MAVTVRTPKHLQGIITPVSKTSPLFTEGAQLQLDPQFTHRQVCMDPDHTTSIDWLVPSEITAAVYTLLWLKKENRRPGRRIFTSMHGSSFLVGMLLLSPLHFLGCLMG